MSRLLTAVLTALIGVAGTSCAAPVVTPSPAAFAWHGAELGKAYPKPPIVLTDQDGHAFDLRRQTEGKLVALYFGYTHCPDACPGTMATLALAVRRLPADLRSRIEVVFITTDPQRDTPAALKSWLANFDPTFVGLTQTGVDDTNDGLIREAQIDAGLGAPATTETPLPGEQNYGVDHGSYVLLYTPGDNLAHLAFLYQTSAQPSTAAGEAADLQELLQHGFHQ